MELTGRDGRSGKREELTEDQLLDFVNQHGFELTRAQLSLIRRRHLIPSPRQRGLGRGRGSQTIYPAETARLLLAVLKEKPHHRSLHEVAWALWWGGVAVPEQAVNDYLANVAQGFDEQVASLRLLLQDPDAMGSLLDQAAFSRLSNPIMAMVRRRTGRHSFSTFIRVAAEVTTGTFSGLSPENVFSMQEEERIIDRALGLTQARKVKILGGSPWLTDPNNQILGELNQLISRAPLSEEAKKAREQDINEARDELRRFLDLVTSFAEVATLSWGRQALGFGTAANVYAALGPNGQAVLFLFWNRLREDPLIRRNIDRLLRAHGLWSDARKHIDTIIQLKGIRALKEILNAKSIRGAMRGSTKPQLT